VKKVLIVAVCLALVLTLAFTLGALGKKPDKPPGKPGYVYVLTFKEELDVTGTVYQCGAKGGFISSSNILRPELCLSGKFDGYSGCKLYPDGLYLDLSEHKGEITMQYFFNDQEGEKVQLNVYGGDVDESYEDREWLSSNFKIIFDDADAEILPTKGKGKKDPDRYENVNITIVCQGE